MQGPKTCNTLKGGKMWGKRKQDIEVNLFLSLGSRVPTSSQSGKKVLGSFSSG